VRGACRVFPILVLVRVLVARRVVTDRDDACFGAPIDRYEKVFAWLVRRPDQVVVDALHQSAEVFVVQIPLDDQHRVHDAAAEMQVDPTERRIAFTQQIGF
jgi:hypothetical protein